MKRRLPVLKSTGEAEPEEPRPPWHWVGFGTAATFGAWLPLQYLAEAVRARLIAGFVGDVSSAEEAARAVAELSRADRIKLSVAVVALSLGPLMLAAFAGGYLVGRYGGEHGKFRVGVREAALGGLATALVVCVLAFAQAHALAWEPLVTIVVAPSLAAWGGRVGVRRRARAQT